MIAYDPFLLDTVHWDLLGAAGAAQAAARAPSSTTPTAASASSSRACWRGWTCTGACAWSRTSDRRALPRPTSIAELLDRTILVVDPRARDVAALDARRGLLPDPGGAAARPAVGVAAAVAGAQRARERLLRRVLAQPHAHLDLAGPGRVRRAGRAARRGARRSRRRRCARGCACALPLAREVGIALMFVVLAAEVSVANPSVPRALRFEHRPEWMVAAVMYPHIFEGWSLFSPEAPLSDETVVVDAVTRDGRHVDPYNEVGSRVSSLPVEGVPGAPRPRLVLVRLHAAHPRRGPVPPGAARVDPALPRADRARPQDQIVRFEAYVIWQDSPKPGETAARPTSGSGASCTCPERRGP